jgi:hypothetical protein
MFTADSLETLQKKFPDDDLADFEAHDLAAWTAGAQPASKNALVVRKWPTGESRRSAGEPAVGSSAGFYRISANIL